MPPLSLVGYTFYLMGAFSMDEVKKTAKHLAPFASKTTIRSFILSCGGECSNALTSKVDIVLVSDNLYYAKPTRPPASVPEFKDYLTGIEKRGPIQRPDGSSDISFLSVKWLIDASTSGEPPARSNYVSFELCKARHDAVHNHEARMTIDCGVEEINGIKALKTSYDGLVSGKYLFEGIESNDASDDLGKRCFFNCVSGVRVENHPANERGPVFGPLPITNDLFTSTDAMKILCGDVERELERWRNCRRYIEEIAKRKRRVMWSQMVNAEGNEGLFEV